MTNSYISQLRIISPPLSRADVREIAHGLIIRTIRYSTQGGDNRQLQAPEPAERLVLYSRTCICNCIRPWRVIHADIILGIIEWGSGIGAYATV